MDALSRDELKALIGNHHSGPCVSIYMPTHRAGSEIRQDPIRLKNLVRQAEEKLTASGVRPADAKQFLSSVQKLERDDVFWRFQDEGLAVFLRGDAIRYYRLPYRFEELVVVADRPHLKPVLPLLQNDGKFYVLCLSKNLVRLLRGTRYSVEEVDLERVPRSLAEGLETSGVESQRAFRTRAMSRQGGGDRTAAYHGHGAAAEDEKSEIFEYFRLIDVGLRELLKRGTAPLVLAGVDYLFPIYREANTYPNLLPAGIPGNADGLKPGVLHVRAWAIVQPYFERKQNEAGALFRELQGTDRTSTDLKRIVADAAHGRVSALFVADDAHQWGAFNRQSGEVVLHADQQPGDRDLLDFAAIETFVQGGEAFVVPASKMPVSAQTAAIYRY